MIEQLASFIAVKMNIYIATGAGFLSFNRICVYYAFLTVENNHVVISLGAVMNSMHNVIV